MSYNQAETDCRHWLEQHYPKASVFKLGDHEPADFLVLDWENSSDILLVEAKSTKKEVYYVLDDTRKKKQVKRLAEFVLREGIKAYLWVKLKGGIRRFMLLHEAVNLRVIR